jgi:hypothetical protein
MTFYRKKPIIVDAVRWTGSNWDEMEQLSRNCNKDCEIVVDNDGMSIVTMEGIMDINIGDWVIRGIDSELYPCKDDVFRKTYDRLIVSGYV